MGGFERKVENADAEFWKGDADAFVEGKGFNAWRAAPEGLVGMRIPKVFRAGKSMQLCAV